MALVEIKMIGTSATFYGVGVGPGDPDLVTVKATKIIGACDVIAYPAANEGESLARKIAAPFIQENTEELAISLPMCTDPTPAQRAYDAAARICEQHLEKGNTIAFLCEGDPLFYGSFIYMQDRLAAKWPIEIIPGITSISACSAAANLPLTRRNDILKVLPATLSEAELTHELQTGDSFAIMKIGRHFEKVSRVLERLNMTDRVTIIEAATRDDQRIGTLADFADGERPYFSTWLITADTNQ